MESPMATPLLLPGSVGFDVVPSCGRVLPAPFAGAPARCAYGRDSTPGGF